MKSNANAYLIFFLLFFTVNPVAHSIDAPKAQKNISRSFILQRLKDGKVLAEENSETLLTPASTSKLVAAAFALETLGIDYEFKTKMFIQKNSRKDGVIRGPILIQGSGDPYITSEKLWQMAADIKNMGIEKIEGDILIDNSLFDDDFRDDSRENREFASRNAYDAPISAFAVNFNTIALNIIPNAGKKPTVTFDPYPVKGFTLKNLAGTHSKNQNSIQVSRNTSKKDLQSTFTITGNISESMLIKKIYRSVSDPLSASGEIVRAFLQAQGISVHGAIKNHKINPSAVEILYEIEGYPLPMMIAGLNKFSNNFIADMLLKKISSLQNTSRPASLGEGNKEMSQYFAKLIANSDCKEKKFNFENASGLSTSNKLTAKQLNTLLTKMYNRLDIFPEFLASLPANGIDGTLEKRVTGKNSNGRMRAKTGTLTEPIAVAALSGYLQHPTEGWLAFSWIDNENEKTSGPGVADLRSIQNTYLTKLLE